MQINLRLDPEKDQDIIDFLEDTPKTYIIKKALRLLITQEEKLFAGVKIDSESPQSEKPVDDLPF